MNFYDLLLQKDVNELYKQFDRLQLEHDLTQLGTRQGQGAGGRQTSTMKVKPRLGLLDPAG